MTRLLLIGGGGHARSCIDVIEATREFEIVGIIDRAGDRTGPVLGYAVLGDHDDLPAALRSTPTVLVTVGQIRSVEARVSLFETVLRLGASLPIVRSPLARIARTASLGAGSIVMHGALVNSQAVIGRNCIVNSHVIVEHDVIVADHCHLAPGAIINGAVSVGTRTFVGSGAVIREGVTIGADCVIGAGATVIDDVPDGATYVGLP